MCDGLVCAVSRRRRCDAPCDANVCSVRAIGEDRLETDAGGVDHRVAARHETSTSMFTHHRSWVPLSVSLHSPAVGACVSPFVLCMPCR